MAVRDFRELIVWQRAIDLTEKIYVVTREFPKHETYGLSSQIQRAAVSVPANIAEGSCRESTKEYLHHIAYALGSLAELTTHLTIAERLEYLAPASSQQLFANCDIIARMLRSLQKSLRVRLRNKRNKE